MKLVRKNQTKTFKNSNTCSAIEYPIADADINGAIIEINGRYPEKGRAMNSVCKEMAYIINGKGRIEIDGKNTELNEGDLILIEPKEKFFWEGNMKMFMPCTPAWTPGQYRETD